MKISQVIQKEMIKKIGKFHYKLIYTNEEEKNYVFLLTKNKRKYVLKVKNNKDNESFDNEVFGRERLRKIIDKAGIKNLIITKIVSYNREQRWILFEYKKFNTLYELSKTNRKEFKKSILLIYNSFFNKLLRKFSPNKRIPGEFSLQDIGFYKGKIYFYDFEVNKTLIEQYRDLYLKICKQYWRAVIKKYSVRKMFLELINFIKKDAQKFNRNKMNNLIEWRLNSPVFKEFKNKKYAKLIEEIRL